MASVTSGGVAGSRQALLSSMERRDRQLIEALRGRQQMVLWFEHDLYDQLLDVLSLVPAAAGVPELIIVGSFPGKPSFRELGELTAPVMARARPGRRQRRSLVPPA